ncbi:MAG: hypothetical protein AAGF01_05690 [Cyanobacteria bacterium P01_G01_bin.38]
MNRWLAGMRILISTLAAMCVWLFRMMQWSPLKQIGAAQDPMTTSLVPVPIRTSYPSSHQR